MSLLHVKPPPRLRPPKISGSDDDDDEVMIEKFSLNQLKIWYIIA